jgi:seryl-tRNA synthetase
MTGHDVGATVAFADYARDVEALRKQLADAQATVEALQRERDEVSRKYHEAMDIMSAWKNIDHAEAVARLLEANKALDAERDRLRKLTGRVVK